MTHIRDHDGEEPRDDICPDCGSQGFDNIGEYEVQGTVMTLRKCWSCGMKFATEVVRSRPRVKPDVLRETQSELDEVEEEGVETRVQSGLDQHTEGDK